MSSNKSNTLVDEKLAVSLFLDSLLRDTEEITGVSEPEIQVVVEPVAKVAVVEPVVEIKTEAPIVEPTTIPNVETEPKIQHENIVVTEDSTVIENELATESIIPEWANEPFQILLFEVAGLKLAVPLVELSGVIEWKDSITAMPGHADFYMGILQHLGNKIAVIDTAKMVLPISKQAQLINDDAVERVNHIVLIDDYKWGLACDKIGEVMTLKPDDVRWRTSNSNRSWLAGTVIEHMCALLNSEGFASMLEKGQGLND